MDFNAVSDIYPGVGDPKAKHPQTFGPLGEIDGKRCVGIIWHTTEYGANDQTRNAALRVARDQSNGQPGSYNWIIYDNESEGSRGGALLCVPYLEASGGINPASLYWNPRPGLKQEIGRAFADPARHMLQVAFQADTADAASMPPNMIETAARLTLWIEAQEWAADELVHVGHMDFQSNRSDPSQAVLDAIRRRRALILERAAAGQPTFSDVPDSHPFYADIEWLAANQISTGTGKGQFGPDLPLTRAQAAAWFRRALQENE